MSDRKQNIERYYFNINITNNISKKNSQIVI